MKKIISVILFIVLSALCWADYSGFYSYKELPQPQLILMKPLSLTIKQMYDITSDLQKYIVSKQLTPSYGMQPLEHYWIQFGYLKPDNTQMIHLNAFCEILDPPEILSKVWENTADGGGCYFSVNYNLEEKTFSCLRINAGTMMSYEDINCEKAKSSIKGNPVDNFEQELKQLEKKQKKD